MKDAVALARKGLFEEALGALARELGLAMKGLVDFDVIFEPKKVFPTDGRDRPACDADGERTARAVVAAARKRWPREALPLLLEGALDVCSGRFERAEELLTKAEKLDPREAWIPMWRFRARCHANFMDRQTCRMQEAVKDLDRAIALDPKNPHAFAWRSRAFKTMTFVDRALLDIDRAIALAPEYVWARAVRGNIHAELNHRDQALADCDHIIGLFPGEAWAWAQTARVRARCGAWSATPKALLSRCVRDLDKAAALAPEDSTIYAWRGEAKRLLGDEAGAEADLRLSARHRPRYALCLVWLARILIMRGDYAEAESILGDAAREMPENELAPAYRWQARLWLGNFEGALDDYRPVSHWNADDLWLPRPKKSADLLPALEKMKSLFPREPWAAAWRGRILATSREPDREAALAELDAALSARPDFFWARLWRAEALHHGGGAARALPDYQRAARLKVCRESLGGLGRALLELGEAEEALRLMSAALKLDPEDTVLRAARGEALVRLGRDAEALEELTELRTSIVRSPEGFYWRAKALSRLGRPGEACASVEKALAFRDDYPEAKALKDELSGAVK